MRQIIIDAMADLDDDLLLEEIKKALAEQVPAGEIVACLQKGLDIVGQRFQEKEYFIADLMLSADLFNEASALLGDEDAEVTTGPKIGKFLIGTVETDIHYIGKNIVAAILRSNGFEVIDIGENVPVQVFADEVEKHKPDVIGMSCLLTTAFDPMKDTIAEIRKRGIKTPILIGGGIVDDQTVEYVKADARCPGPQDDVILAKKFLGVE